MKLNKYIPLSTVFIVNSKSSIGFNIFNFFFRKMNSMSLLSLKSEIRQKSEKNC